LNGAIREQSDYSITTMKNVENFCFYYVVFEILKSPIIVYFNFVSKGRKELRVAKKGKVYIKMASGAVQML
jgi:hypothetical protein